MFTVQYVGAGETSVSVDRVRYLLRAAKSRGVCVFKMRGARIISDCCVVIRFTSQR